MKNKHLSMIMIVLSILLVMTFSSCNATIQLKHNSTTINYVVDYPSVWFYSVDELLEAVHEYPACVNEDNRFCYERNKFGELIIDYYPQVDDYKLKGIEINEYNVFYYFIPIAKESNDQDFNPNAGIIVEFGRRENGGPTIDSLQQYYSASLGEDGSFFVEKYNVWVVPVGENCYIIDFPDSMKDCQKEIVKIVAVD